MLAPDCRHAAAVDKPDAPSLLLVGAIDAWGDKRSYALPLEAQSTHLPVRGASGFC